MRFSASYIPLCIGILIPSLHAETARIIGEVSDGRQIIKQPSKVIKPDFTVNWSKISYEQGRKVTISQVAPPIQQLASAPAKVTMLESTLPQVNHGGTFMVFAKVYNNRFSKIEWNHDGEKFEAWSNINFTHLEGFTSFEGRGKNYTFMLLCGPTSESLTDDEHQQLAALKSITPSYTVTKGDTTNDASMEFIEAIHDLYEVEKDKLITAYQARIRNAKQKAIAERRLSKSPPPKKDLTIHFWKRDVQAEQKGGQQ